MNNYPLGADNPNAPWNQHDPDPIVTNCCVSYSLSKSMPVVITNYTPMEEYDSDIDDEGHSYYGQRLVPNFDNTNFEEEFDTDNGALGIPTLLEHLKSLTQEKIERLEDEFSLTRDEKTRRSIRSSIIQYNNVLRATYDWNIDEFCVVPE